MYYHKKFRYRERNSKKMSNFSIEYILNSASQKNKKNENKISSM